MSLRTVHLVFILSVIGLFLFCAGLAYQEQKVVLAAGSLFLAGGFMTYFFYVLRKLKKIPS